MPREFRSGLNAPQVHIVPLMTFPPRHITGWFWTSRYMFAFRGGFNRAGGGQSTEVTNGIFADHNAFLDASDHGDNCGARGQTSLAGRALGRSTSFSGRMRGGCLTVYVEIAVTAKTADSGVAAGARDSRSNVISPSERRSRGENIPRHRGRILCCGRGGKAGA